MSSDDDRDEKELSLTSPEVVTKYKSAAEIVNKALQVVLAECKPKAKIVDICEKGDDFIKAQTLGINIAKKKIKAGVAFPTCISVNNTVAHFSPLASDETVLEDGDMVKIDMGCHIDGFIALVGHTHVLQEGPVSGRKADVIAAANDAAEVALKLVRPGNKNTQVTEAIQKVAAAYGCKIVEGVLSHQMKQFIIDGSKSIISVASPETRVEDVEFEENEVYAIDIVASTGDGNPQLLEENQTTIYKRDERVKYLLEMKASRFTFSEIKKTFSCMPFTARSLEEKRALPGLVECVNNSLLQPYPVLYEKPGDFVAQIKFTVLLLPNGSERITSHTLQELQHTKIVDELELSLDNERDAESWDDWSDGNSNEVGEQRLDVESDKNMMGKWWVDSDSDGSDSNEVGEQRLYESDENKVGKQWWEVDYDKNDDVDDVESDKDDESSDDSRAQIVIKLGSSSSLGYEDGIECSFLKVRCLPGNGAPKLHIAPKKKFTVADANKLLSLIGDQENALEGQIIISQLMGAAQKVLLEFISKSDDEASKPSCSRKVVQSSYPHVHTERYLIEFEEEGFLGRGGFGHVMLCRHKLDKKLYAIKKIHVKKKRNIPRRVMREVNTLSLMESRHIVRYHSAWSERGFTDYELDHESAERVRHPKSSQMPNTIPNDEDLCLFIQMEYCKRTLREFLDEYEVVNTDFAWRSMREMAKGLEHIHEANIIHRDFKPGNIFLDAKDHIKIGDFGLATFFGNDTQNVAVSGSSGVPGTFFYRAPEIESPDIIATPAADIFSFGVVVFELWHPFQTGTERSIHLTALRTGVVPLEWEQKFPMLADLVLRMVSQVAANRPSAQQVRIRVQELLNLDNANSEEKD